MFTIKGKDCSGWPTKTNYFHIFMPPEITHKIMRVIIIETDAA